MRLSTASAHRKSAWIGLGLCALAAGALLGLVSNGTAHAAREIGVAATPLAIPRPEPLPNNFAELAKRLQPSVVKVTSTHDGQETRTRDPQDEGPEDAPDLPPHYFRGGGSQRVVHGGSGVIVDPKGYILTNHHVVAQSSRIQVKLYGDPRLYTARLIGADAETDLAVIRIEPGRPLQAAPIGNSDAVQVGDWVLAIGSPFGFLEGSVTAGIVSAKGRDLGDPDHQLQRFLQTDAAINHGNSGGPLLNMRGELIGINTAMASETGGYAGIGFALPVNMAVRVYNEVIRTGKVSRGAIGITFNRQQNPALLKAYGASEGVFVQSVNPSGPAGQAGIQAGDIIVGFQGKPVHSSDELLAQVADTSVGSAATVTILRDSRKMELRLTVGDRAVLAAAPARVPAGERTPGEPEEAGGVHLGISVRGLAAADREHMQLPESAGVLIEKVEPGSFAEDIGLEEGDVMTAVNRQPVRSIDELRRIQRSFRPGQPVAFRILRKAGRGGTGWQAVYLAGTLGNR